MNDVITNNARIEKIMADIDSAIKSLDRMRANRSISINGVRFLTDEHLSSLIHISKRALLTYRQNGVLPYYHCGGKILYKETDIEKLLSDNRYEVW